MCKLYSERLLVLCIYYGLIIEEDDVYYNLLACCYNDEWFFNPKNSFELVFIIPPLRRGDWSLGRDRLGLLLTDAWWILYKLFDID